MFQTNPRLISIRIIESLYFANARYLERITITIWALSEATTVEHGRADFVLSVNAYRTCCFGKPERFQ